MSNKQFSTMSEVGDHLQKVSELLTSYFTSDEVKGKEVIILHHTDMDGISAREILRSFLNQYTEYRDIKTIAYNYEKDYDFASFNPDGLDVISVDLSLKVNDIELISQVSHRFIMTDHHATSIRQFGSTSDRLLRIVKPNEESSDNEFNTLVLLDTNRCGAKIVYDVLKKTKCPDNGDYAMKLLRHFGNTFDHINPVTVDLIDQYDRWVYTDNDPVYLNEYFYASNRVRMPDNEFYFLRILTKRDINEFLKIGRDIFNAKRIISDIQADNFTRPTTITIGDKTYTVCRGYGFTNSLGFGDKMKEYDICETIRYYDQKTGRYTVSLYTSNPDIDVSRIAELFGGGGHPGAAGFCSTEYI